MGKEDDRNTPIPFPVNKSLSKRVKDVEDKTSDLETGQGVLAGDIGKLDKRVKYLESEEQNRNSDRPSQAEFSMRPTGVRAKFSNINAWVVIGAILLVTVLFVSLALILGK